MAGVNSPTPEGSLIGIGGNPIWEALSSDSGAGIVVVDSEGTIAYRNDVAAMRWGQGGSAGNDAGRSAKDLYPEEFLNERMGIVRRVLQTGRPVVMDGLVKGQMLRTVYRALPRGTEAPRCLCVCRPLVPDMSSPVDPTMEYVRARVDDAGPLEQLTARELEILRLIGQGLSTAEIARLLHRSVKTVEWHRVSLGNKLGAGNRVELARIAIRAGLVGVSTPVTATVDRGESGAK